MNFWEFLNNVITKIIDKLNIVVILLALVVFGVWNDERVFTWMKVIGTFFKGLLP